MRKILFVVLITTTAILNNCFASDFYCGEELVGIGDTTYDVSMKCEKSKWTDNIEYEVVQKIESGDWNLVHVNKDIWVYNFGPNRFMKKLVFLNDKLHEIKDLDYGYLEKDIGSFGNKESKLYIQMSKPEVLIHWGVPDNKTSVVEKRLHKVHNSKFIKYDVKISKWVYNFGPNQFLKTIVFENDRLIEINSGTYGYDK